MNFPSDVLPKDLNEPLRAAFLADVGFEVFTEPSSRGEVGKLSATFGMRLPASGGPLTPEGAAEVGRQVARNLGAAFRTLGAVALVQITPITALRLVDGGIDVFWDGCGVCDDGSLVSIVKSAPDKYAPPQPPPPPQPSV